MLKEYEMTANCKVNLFLKVYGSLPNGYHRLSTVMQEIAFGDDILVSIDNKKRFHIVLDSDVSVPVKEDLCYKAARLYIDMLFKRKIVRSKYNLPHIKIKVEKRVPVESGLGGGSSDAACILLILNEYFENVFTVEELSQMAYKLGADVPFFIFGKTTYCEGIGELITPVESLAGVDMVIVKPKFGVPTGECFKRLDKKRKINKDITGCREIIQTLNNSKIKPVERLKEVSGELVNDMETVAIDIVPEIKETLEAIKDYGSFLTMMSGSGSSCYGLFENSNDALVAAGKLSTDERTQDSFIYVTRFI